MKQNEVIAFVKAFLLRYAISKFVVAVLAAGLTLLTVAFAGGLEIDVSGELFGTRFKVSYGNSNQTLIPALIGLGLIFVSVWLFIKAQREPASIRIQKLEDLYRARGSDDSVQETFFEVFSIRVRSPSELEYLMDSKNLQSLATSLRRARSHVEFSTLGGYVLATPRIPYKFLKLASSTVYFSAVIALMLASVFTVSAIAGPDKTALPFFLSIMFLAFLLAWVSLSAYSSIFHTLKITAQSS